MATPRVHEPVETLKLFREVKAPPPHDGGVTVLCLVKNELFYLRPFLDHYRRLGVSRFVFLDDGSDDGGLEYLLQQADCGVVTSELAFDQPVNGKRAETVWRTALAQTYCDDRWTAVVDADEFIVLPPGYDNLARFTDKLDEMGARIIGAAMIDFYPANIADLDNSAPPGGSAELFDRYPYFDDYPHGRWERGTFWRAYGGVRARLITSHGLAKAAKPKSLEQSIRSAWLKLLGRSKPAGFNAIHKVPLVRWTSRYEYVHPHSLNTAPRSDIQLPLAHFKFTGSFASKTAAAMVKGAYFSNDARVYVDLLDAMRRGDGSFLCDVSRRYSRSEDFVASELVRFPGVGPRRRRSIRQAISAASAAIRGA